MAEALSLLIERTALRCLLLFLNILLLSCGSSELPTVQEDWWRGSWTLDSARLSQDPSLRSLSPQARAQAQKMLHALAPELRFYFEPGRCEKHWPGGELRWSCQNQMVQGEVLLKLNSGEASFRLQRQEEGILLLESNRSLPLKRPESVLLQNRID